MVGRARPVTRAVHWPGPVTARRLILSGSPVTAVTASDAQELPFVCYVCFGSQVLQDNVCPSPSRPFDTCLIDSSCFRRSILHVASHKVPLKQTRPFTFLQTILPRQNGSDVQTASVNAMAAESVSPQTITRQEFDAVLARYEPLIKTISSAKGGKYSLSVSGVPH